MKVFTYNAGKDPPFSELYKTVAEKIIISNQQQHVDSFATEKDRLMRLVGENVVWFVPMAVEKIFLSWFSEKNYKKLEKLPTSTKPTCEILGYEEFNEWFKNDVAAKVEEEREVVEELEVSVKKNVPLPPRKPMIFISFLVIVTMVVIVGWIIIFKYNKTLDCDVPQEDVKKALQENDLARIRELAEKCKNTEYLNTNNPASIVNNEIKIGIILEEIERAKNYTTSTHSQTP